MEDHSLYYDTLIRVTNAISECRDPEDVALMTATSVKTAFKAKGCAVFLIKRDTGELGLAASDGLSDEYLKKGPLHFMQSIKDAHKAGPIAIYDVQDDPRIQYPDEAKKEGISSFLGVPIVAHGKIIGALRVYTSEPWEFTINDITLVQAVAQICGMAMDMCRMYKGYKTSVEILKSMRDKDSFKSNKWTPYEGSPTSVTQSVCDY